MADKITQGPLIIGLGNPLMGDDGIGITVARFLKARDLAAEIVEAGTPGFGLADILMESRPILFIDAVDAGSKPGSVFWVDPAFLEHGRVRHSLHQVNLADALDLMDKLGRRASIKIIGIQPLTVGVGVGLSQTIEGCLEEIVARTESMVVETLPDVIA